MVASLCGMLTSCAMFALPMVLVAWIAVYAIRSAARRVPARGILLAVDRQPLGPNRNQTQQRSVTIDVEIEGKPPFTVNSIATVPLRFIDDVLPGATIAIIIDPTSPGTLTVSGPGMALPAFAVAAPPRTTS